MLFRHMFLSISWLPCVIIEVNIYSHLSIQLLFFCALFFNLSASYLDSIPAKNLSSSYLEFAKIFFFLIGVSWCIIVCVIGVWCKEFIVFKGFTPCIAIIKYWLYSLCCTIYPGSLLYPWLFGHLSRLPLVAPPPCSSSPLVTANSFCLWTCVLFC